MQLETPSMPRPARSRITPWIETLILNYGSAEGARTSGGLKAHVIGMGPVSQSQTQNSGTATGLLFLSDGELQIPAVLTASAWEHLQDKEDRESFASLLSTTVCIQEYLLQFHMAAEQNKSRFFLSIGELATTATGPCRDNMPCSTSLASIRLKICKTWSRLQGQESQPSQHQVDLSELLGEWQQEFMQDMIQDIEERVDPVSPQPSTSTHTPSLPRSAESTATSWDVERVRCTGARECFSIHSKCLLILEDESQQLQKAQNFGSRFRAASKERKRDLPQVCRPSESPEPSADSAERQIPKASAAVDDILHEDLFTGLDDGDIRPLSNPWDIFPPPCDTSSSSDLSPEVTPTHSLHNPGAADPKPALTGTCRHVQEEDSPKTMESSFLPPYQKPPPSLRTTVGSSASASSQPRPFKRQSVWLPSTGEPHAAQKQNALCPEKEVLEKDATEETYQGKSERAKRNRSMLTTEELSTLVEEENEEFKISESLPSWLSDSQTGSRVGNQAGNQDGVARTVLRKPPLIHSDGRPFSYSYQTSEQNLQDLSHFRVSESRLHWAVKYLVPKCQPQ